MSDHFIPPALPIPSCIKKFHIIDLFGFVCFAVRIADDGDMWGALIGEDLQNGVSGFGRSIPQALRNLADRIELASKAIDETNAPTNVLDSDGGNTNGTIT